MPSNLRPEHQKILEEIRSAKGCSGKTRPCTQLGKGQAQPASTAGQGDVPDSVNGLPSRYDQARPDPSVGPPATASAADGPPTVRPTDGALHSQESELPARLQGGADLMKLLGFAAVYRHGLDIMLFYLIGLAYRRGAPSVRKVYEMLRKPPPEILADDLAVRIGKAIETWEHDKNTVEASSEELKSFDVPRKDLYATIPNLEFLLKAPLVRQLGAGLPFAGLTEVGEAFWQVVAEYLRSHL
jgi:hypothetical protein